MGAAVTIPDEVTQELTTNVIVPDGSTIVLGGLFKETSKRTRRQVPLLGDIPVIGIAFRGHEDNTDRAEIMFLIKPTVMNDQVLIEQGDRALAYGDRVRTGSRQGLLFRSRHQTLRFPRRVPLSPLRAKSTISSATTFCPNLPMVQCRSGHMQQMK